jgi:signal peptidase I
MSGQANHRREEVVATLAADMLRSFGEFWFVARGCSMVPSIFPGDTLIVQRETPQDASKGEVVLFAREGRFHAHRLVDKKEEGGAIRLIARGDAVVRDDPPFAESEMIGRVAAVIRGRKRIELDRRPVRSERLLRWIMQRSPGSVKWLLRWYSVRARFAGNAESARVKLAEWQPQESV